MKFKLFIIVLITIVVFLSGCITIVNETPTTEESLTGSTVVEENVVEDVSFQFEEEKGVSKEEAKKSVIEFYRSLGENFYKESSFLRVTREGDYWKVVVLEDGVPGIFEVNQITGEVDYLTIGGVRKSIEELINEEMN